MIMICSHNDEDDSIGSNDWANDLLEPVVISFGLKMNLNSIYPN